MLSRRSFSGSFTLMMLAALTLSGSLGAASCSSQSSTLNTGGAGGTGGAGTGTGGSGTGTGGDVNFQDAGNGPFADFPKDPVIEMGLPPGIPGLFDNTPGMDSGGPCLAEPALEAMVPRNWTPLFFEWNAPPDLNVFELKLSVDNQTQPLVVYTTTPSFTIDKAMWKGLTSHSGGHDITVMLRGARLEGNALTIGPKLGAIGALHLAPVDAPGSVVYWTSSGGTSFQGFTIGDENVKTLLTPAQAGTTSTGGNTTCVSCHTSSPDGKLLIYTRDADNQTRAIDIRKLGGGAPDPTAVSPSALALLGRHKQSAPIFSKAHYSASDAVGITVMSDPNLNGGRYELAWTDLHAADANGWGVLARNGDPRNVSSPSWRHDGSAIAYVSSAAGGEGVIADVNAGDPTMDIYTVPYNNKQGGNAAPLPGASEPNVREFYPVYSPDDTLLAFNRTDQPVNSYDQPSAELFLLPADGGQAVRLKANDPPACTGLASPGRTNSWARWAPRAEQAGDLKYYWLVFSSKRRPASTDGANLRPQLYISSVVTKINNGTEVLEAEYPALYVTTQSPSESNHTPAWDVFEVNQVPQ